MIIYNYKIELWISLRITQEMVFFLTQRVDLFNIKIKLAVYKILSTLFTPCLAFFKLKGLGYRLKKKHHKLILLKGKKSHVYPICSGNFIKYLEVVDKYTLFSFGFLSYKFQEFSNYIKKIESPDLYKGKGLRISKTIFRLKVGKQTQL